VEEFDLFRGVDVLVRESELVFVFALVLLPLTVKDICCSGRIRLRWREDKEKMTRTFFFS